MDKQITIKHRICKVFPTKETRGIYAYEFNYYFRLTTYIVKLMTHAIEKMKSGPQSECTLWFSKEVNKNNVYEDESVFGVKIVYSLLLLLSVDSYI